MSNTLAYASLGQKKKKKTVKKKPSIKNLKDLRKAMMGAKRGGKR
tara:strand:+ start:316 stop:450 length:135 start_codon:yes stop_codon:yes gene_type:complete